MPRTVAGKLHSGKRSSVWIMDGDVEQHRGSLEKAAEVHWDDRFVAENLMYKLISE